jgi:hypothetical protein
MKKISFLFVLLIILFTVTSVRADVAPPETPPGADIAPGDETTQVRMLAETVTLTILENVPEDSLGKAATRAIFTMHNISTDEEYLEVRFPLTFWDGRSDGFFNYPEIQDLRVRVNSVAVRTHRITTPNPYDSDDPEVPWAAFDVNFPPGEDVIIEVEYTTHAFGDVGSPFAVYRYVLQTGAGWQGTIGSADIIVRLPYEVNNLNILLEGSPGFGGTKPNPILTENEVRWHYEDFEPTWEHDMEIVIITPQTWNKVLRERQNVNQNANDGEAWGRLGLAYKTMIKYRRGLREDAGGQELYALSVQAYENALALLPDDAAWHYGFADLLWARYAWDLYYKGGEEAQRTLVRALEELDISLQLNPNDERAINLADDMYYWVPEYVDRVDGKYTFLALTVTPAMPTPSPRPTETSTPLSPTSALSTTPETATMTATLPSSTNTHVPPTKSPPSPTTASQQQERTDETPQPSICGAAIFLPFMVGAVLVTRRCRYITERPTG